MNDEMAIGRKTPGITATCWSEPIPKLELELELVLGLGLGLDSTMS